MQRRVGRATGDRRRTCVRTPWPRGSCHQCCTSPSTNCRDAAWRMCAAREMRRREDQRQDVLQLIAEAERAARLIEARAAPDAAGQGLIEEPPVQQQVHRAVRRRDLHGPEDAVPESRDVAERVVHALGRAAAPHDRSTRWPRQRPRRAGQHRRFLSGLERDGQLHGAARVERRAGAIGEASTAERGRRGERPVSPDELGPVGRQRAVVTAGTDRGRRRGPRTRRETDSRRPTHRWRARGW